MTRRAVWRLLTVCLALSACAAPPVTPAPAPAPHPAPDVVAPPPPSPPPPSPSPVRDDPPPVGPTPAAPSPKPAAPAVPPGPKAPAPPVPPAQACTDALAEMTRLLRPADRPAMMAAEQSAWREAVAAGYRAVAVCRASDQEGLALFRRGTALFLARDYTRAEQDIRRSAGLPGPHNTDGYAASFAKLLRACGGGSRFSRDMETYRQAVVLETAGLMADAKDLYATLHYSGCPDLAWRGRYSQLRMEVAPD